MPLTDNIAAYWTLDEASGTRADSVGTSTLTDPTSAPSAAGKLGNAASFNGTSQYLTCAPNPALNVVGSDFTVAAWVRLAAKTNGYAVAKTEGANDQEFILGYDSGSDRLRFQAGQSGEFILADTLGSPSLDTWYHVVAWFDSAAATLSVAVDGGAADVRASVTYGTPDGTGSFFVGAMLSFFNFWPGQVDEVGLWKRALTPAERAALYNGGAGITYPFAGASPVAVPVTDPNLVFSPYNWDSDGAGAAAANHIRASSTFARSNNPGAYLKAGFTGTSVLLGVDVSAMTAAALPAASYPRIGYSVDGAAWAFRQLTSTDSQVALATGLAAGTHTLDAYFAGVDQLVNNFGDRWTTPVNAVVVTGLVIDAGATTAAPAARARLAIVYGDSIAEGTNNSDLSGSVTGQDAGRSWAVLLALALDAEYGLIGFASQGYAVPASAGYGGVPSLADAWDSYSAGRPRLVAGRLVPPPDYVVSGHGTNDNSSLTADQVSAQVAAWRAAAPSAAILICQTFGQVAAAAIAAGVALYRAANPADAGIHLLDPGVALNAPQNSLDGLHPSTRGDAIYGAMLAAGAAAGGGTAGAFAPIGCAFIRGA